MSFLNSPDKYPCKYCNMKFRVKESLRSHLREQHKQELIEQEHEFAFKKRGDFIIQDR